MEDIVACHHTASSLHRSLSLPPNERNVNPALLRRNFVPRASDGNKTEPKDSLFNRIGSMRQRLRMSKKVGTGINR